MYTSPSGDTCYLIALEGADRLGKSTQIRLVEEALKAAPLRVVVDKSPCKDGVTYDRIYEMLATGEAVEHPVVFQTIYGVNRRYFQEHHLPALAERFDLVLLDRWSLSTRVYGAESGVPEETTECILRGLVEPDISIVLDGEPFQAEGGDDSYEADAGFQERVRARYRRWAHECPEAVVLVDANAERLAVRDVILALVRNRVPAITGLLGPS